MYSVQRSVRQILRYDRGAACTGCTRTAQGVSLYLCLFQVGKVYYISRATLKTANKQFNNLKNDYEMTLIGDSEIIPCHDSGDDIPTLQFNFIPICDVEKREKNDLMGI